MVRRIEEPLRSAVGLSIGFAGMSTLFNLLGFSLVFYYLPPDGSGLEPRAPEAPIFGVFSSVALVLAAGRLLDAISDPVVAAISDRQPRDRGRRTPLMTVAAPLAAGLTALVFVPPASGPSAWNLAWIFLIQAALFVALSAYSIPANALVADLGATRTQRLNLSLGSSFGWACGIAIAGSIPSVAALVETVTARSENSSWQVAAALLSCVALVAMLVPRILVDEAIAERHRRSRQSTRNSIRLVLADQEFRRFMIADFAYFASVMILQAGLLFYFTELLDVPEESTAPLLGLLILLSLVLYPWARRVALRLGPITTLRAAFAAAAVCFGLLTTLGWWPLGGLAQGTVLIVLFSPPFAILSLLPAWVVAEFAERAAVENEESNAGMYFAARAFLQKLAQTFGIFSFASLALLGRSAGDDLGLRLSPLPAVALYIAALLALGPLERSTSFDSSSGRR